MPVGQATAKSGESGNQLICNWKIQFLRIESAGMWIDLSLFFVVGRPVDDFLVSLFLGDKPAEASNLILRKLLEEYIPACSGVGNFLSERSVRFRFPSFSVADFFDFSAIALRRDCSVATRKFLSFSFSWARIQSRERGTSKGNSPSKGGKTL